MVACGDLLQVAKRELALECNYTYEAAAQVRFRELVNQDEQLSEVGSESL
jgi:predicted unusual protein kinase regulating ubiquinone biosynthesis (AarF/ABC1/UbiB family)